MIKMLKKEKIPNLLWFVSRDDQLASFTMLTPFNKNEGSKVANSWMDINKGTSFNKIKYGD